MMKRLCALMLALMLMMTAASVLAEETAAETATTETATAEPVAEDALLVTINGEEIRQNDAELQFWISYVASQTGGQMNADTVNRTAMQLAMQYKLLGMELEKQGKTSAPKQSQYSTSYEQQEEYVPVKETVYDKKSRNQNKDTVKILLMKFFRICRENSFCITRYDETIIKFPVLFLLLAILIWKIVLPLLIVGLFFHFRYSFEGRNDLSKVNDFMDSAGNMADRVKREFTRGEKEEK